MQLGIRPEFLSLAGGTDGKGGLPFRVTRVEDVGRHRIVRGMVGTTATSVIVPEGQPVPQDTTHIRPDPAGINVYADDWRVEPL
jgi:glycerol transport system ATP-binding protein